MVVDGYFDAGSTLSLQCTHELGDEVTHAEVRIAESGQNGPLAFTFPEVDNGMVWGTWPLSTARTVDLLLGRLYVLLTTAHRPAGALRGQVLNPPIPGGLTWMLVPLTEGGVPPREGGVEKGRCVFGVRYLVSASSSVEPDNFLVVACRHSLAGPTGAELRRRGTAESIPLSPTGVSPFVWSLNWTWPPPIGGLNGGLLDAELEIVVHHAGGEIVGRAQGCPHRPDLLCLTGNRFGVHAAHYVDDHAVAAHAVPLTRDSGLFWFFDPENQEMLVKVLDACVVNGYFWVFYAATTNVGFQLDVADLATAYDIGEFRYKIYSNPSSHKADTVLDVAAFPCP